MGSEEGIEEKGALWKATGDVTPELAPADNVTSRMNLRINLVSKRVLAAVSTQN